jgi:copper chaperone CopZ
MRLFALLAPLALLLAACGECEHCKRGTEAPTPTATASADASANPFAAEPEAAPPTVKTAWRGSGKVIELSVWKMRCGGCEKTVEDTLAAPPGVTSARADHVTSTVTVELADAAQRDAVIPQIRASLKPTDFQILGE